MIYPVIPAHNRPIISVEKSVFFIVSRFIERTPYQFEVQRAANWEALEDQARQVVENLVGAPTSDYYPCPDDLAEQAVWPEEED